jgi:glutamine synthetase
LPAALHRFKNSADARRLLGEDVVGHYSHFLTKECEAYEAAVTDWEKRRYFERI